MIVIVKALLGCNLSVVVSSVCRRLGVVKVELFPKAKSTDWHLVACTAPYLQVPACWAGEAKRGGFARR